jgi:hypothetical protein
MESCMAEAQCRSAVHGDRDGNCELFDRLPTSHEYDPDWPVSLLELGQA